METGELECLLWVNVLFDHGGNTGQGLSSALLWATTGTQDPLPRTFAAPDCPCPAITVSSNLQQPISSEHQGKASKEIYKDLSYPEMGIQRFIP